MFGYRSKERWVFGAFAASILFLCYVVDRTQFAHLILGYSLAFYAYYYWIEKRRFRTLKAILTHAIIIRLLILFALPQLSDDYHRFIWDGLIQLRGINPFALLPTEISEPSSYMSELLTRMNSPDYYSVYPPMLQWIWHGASLLVGEDSLHQVILMRCLIILSDVGVILVGVRILRFMGKWEGTIALYALNPLVIVELTGNLHFEGMMIFFTLLGIYGCMRYRSDKVVIGLIAGGAAIAAGVLTKIVLILALPAMWRRWGAWRTLLIGLVTMVFVGLGFYSFIDQELIQHFGQSLDLYFRNFQFNSSVFQLTMSTASQWIPYYTVETVGPYVTLGMILSIVAIALFRTAKTDEAFFETLLFILSVHLLFASTVHPWYIINLVAIAMFTTYRFPMLWSFAAVLSYFMYANELIEVWWIIGIEYVLVLGYAIWEFARATKFNRSTS